METLIGIVLEPTTNNYRSINQKFLLQITHETDRKLYIVKVVLPITSLTVS